MGGTAMGNLGAELGVIWGEPHRTHPIQGGPPQCLPQTSSSPALGTSMGRGWRTPPHLGGPGRRRRTRPSWRKVGAGGVAPQGDCGAGPRAPQKGRARGAAGGGRCHGAAPGTPRPPHPPPPRAPQPRGTQRSRAARAGGPRGCGAGGGPRLRAALGRGPAAPPPWGGGSEVLMESTASSPGRGRARGEKGSPDPNPPRSPERRRRRARRRRSGRRNGALRESAVLGCWGGTAGCPPPPPHIPNASPGKSSASKADSRGGPKSAAGGTASTGTFPGPLWGGGAQCPARGSVSPPGTSPSCTCLPVPPRVPSPCCHLQGGGMRLGTWRERGRRDPQDRGTPARPHLAPAAPPGRRRSGLRTEPPCALGRDMGTGGG